MRGYVCAVGLLGLAGVTSVFIVRPPKNPPGTKAGVAATSLWAMNSRRMATPATFSIPLSFEPNLGQAGARAQFLGRGQGVSVAITDRGIELDAPSYGQQRAQPNRIRIEFAGSRRPRFSWYGEDRLNAVSNYLLGSDRRRWRVGVPHFARVAAEDVAPGVGMVVYGRGQDLEFDLVLAPRAKVSGLRLRISGTEKRWLDSGGDLVLQAAGREFRMKRPTAYEEIGTSRQPVDCSYAILADGTIGFRVGPHHPGARLVIDPVLSVAYATFLGGSGDDSANSLAMDSAGKLYIGGTTTQASFPESGVQLGPGGGSTDYFIAKIDATQTGQNSLVYLTFLGGSGTEAGGLIAADSKGDVFVSGTTTSTDFPVTDSSKRTSGANDVTVSELDPTGAKLVFSTLFGGNGAEATQNGGGIALGNSGDIFIASDTTSSDLPVTDGALKSSFSSSNTDGFLVVFTPSTTAGATPELKYCTYVGLNAQVGVSSLASDANGNAYLAGFTSDPGTSFPATEAFQSAYGGGDFDAFLMKIHPAGSGSTDLVYATLLGGSGSDQAFAVAVDTATPPNAYVTGTTQSPNFPVNGKIAAFQTQLNPTTNAANAFVTVVTQNPSTLATSLMYSTYLGGSQTDAGSALALSSSGAGPVIYVAGQTSSADFPWHDNFQPFNGDQDAFLAKLEPALGGSNSLVYSTPLGGTAAAGVTALAQANGVLTDGSGHIYLVGSTTAADFPRAGNPQNGAQVVCGSCQDAPPLADAFLTEVSETPGSLPSLVFKASGGARNLNFGSQPVGSQNVPPQPAVIANTGDAALSISGMSITGPNTPDFSLLGSQSCIGANLAPQQQCSFEVAFVPSKAGPEEAFVAVSDNAPGNPQLLALVAGYTPPFAVPSPSAITFATIPQGSATASQRITLLNSGNQVLVFASDASIAGADRGQFKKVADTCFQSQNLAADTSCYVDVAFAPVASGQFQAQLQFIDNSSNVTNSVQSVSLSGMATPAPVAALNPLNLGFSEQGVGTTSSVESISLMNAGSVTLNITNVSISGPDAASFGLVATGNRPCPNSGGTLGSGLACTVGVDFTPQSSGVKTANLVFSDNASGSPQMVPLTGTGTMPAIQLSPTSLTFGSAQNPQPIGVPSAPQNVTVTSTGSSPLSLNTITISGTSDFSIKNNNCPAALGTSSPNNACTISVAFTPSVPGTESASLTINDNAPGSPHSVALSGTGAQQSAVSVSPNSVSFGNEIGGTSSAAQTLTVKNTGNGALAVSGISFSGTNPGDFSEKDTCTGNRVTIAPNATCTVSVTFAPANNGSANANLVLTDNAPDSPESVPLSGSGVDFTIGAASGAETTAKVTAGQTAMYSLVVAGGAGSVQLACSGAPSAAACSAPASAAAGTPFMVSVSTRANSIVVRRMPIVLQDPGSRQPVSLVLVAFAVAAIVAARRRSTPATHVLRGAAAAILFAIALVACGGGGGDPSSIISGTPPGQYTVTITGSAGGTSHSVALTLVVH